jgi:hypothetical protein
MHGPICIFWANLTPFSLKAITTEMLVKDLQGQARLIQARLVLPSCPGPPGAVKCP